MSTRLSDSWSENRFLSSAKGPEMKKFFRNPVTSDDRHIISQFLIDAEKDAKECQAEINRLTSKIYSLEAKQSGLKKTLEKYRSLLSPVHRLPTEILGHIFSFELSPQSTTPVQRLTMVCGRWREVALSTPSLWASVSLKFIQWKGKMAALNVLTGLFMTRSKSSPLQLNIGFQPFDVEDDPSPIISTLSAHFARWQYLSLNIDLSFDQSQYLFPNIRGESLQLLQRLRIIGTGRSNIDAAGLLTTLPGLFSVCPALHSVELGPSRFLNASLALPWHQIRSVVIPITKCPSQKVFDFVALFPALRTLEFPTVRGRPTNHTHLKSVESFICSFGAEHEVESSFNPLTLSALTSLKMVALDPNGFKDQKGWPEIPLFHFLDRSACSLTHISLKWLPLTDSQTLSLLRRIPTIANVRIEEAPGQFPNSIVTEHFLQSLTVGHETFSSGSLPLVPSLTDISLVVRAEGLEEYDFLLMVSSRHFADPALAKDVAIECLQSLSITVMGGDSEADQYAFNSLKCFRDSGLRLHIGKA